MAKHYPPSSSASPSRTPLAKRHPLNGRSPAPCARLDYHLGGLRLEFDLAHACLVRARILLARIELPDR
eukprot:7996590-Heterocapsa_arctica.AAC.1